MSSSSRFAAPTSSLDLGTLLHSLRRAFWVCVGFAAFLHLVLVLLDPFEETQQKAPRPITTKFVKREPRLTKPLELRKLPQPRRQMIRRQVRLVQARMDQVQATAALNTRTLLSGTGPSRMALSRAADTDLPTAAAGLEPTLSPVEIANTRIADNRVDMALEMLDIHNMDTGRYQAMVVQDASNRQAIKGFVKFAHVIAASSIELGSVGHHGRLNLKTIDLLVDALNEFTGVKAQFVGSITYDDERLMEMPIIIPSGAPNESEMEHLARYVLAGGFIFGGVSPEYLEKYGGLVNGQDFWTESLPESHPVFSVFFDIKGGGVPSGRSTQSKNYRGSWRGLNVTGYFVQGRMAGIGGVPINTQTRTLQMDINVILYALTQEGSMTQRLMQMVN